MPLADGDGRDGDGRVEFLKDRLYWLVNHEPALLEDTFEAHHFTIDDTLVYPGYLNDFGPLDLGMTHWFVKMLYRKLHDPTYANANIFLVCADDEGKRANAAFLICAYFVIMHQVSPVDAFEPFRREGITFRAFRDAGHGPGSFTLSIVECLRGLEVGISLGWYNRKTFKLKDYVYYQRMENGDMNWIIPNQLLAFASPTDRNEDVGYPSCSAADLVPVFQAKSVSVVIRLNNKEYDEDVFIQNGIEHLNLFFEDGSCPPAKIINTFLATMERTHGAVAVHCKAGLGRTGTLAGLFAMMRYGMQAREFIAWSRLCRPGCVIGPQQQFLVDMQPGMFLLGGVQVTQPLSEAGRLRIEAARQHTEDGQSQRLLEAKKAVFSNA